MNDSSFWVNHFKHNATKKRVNWALPATITNQEKKQLLYSIKAWQKGETSDGSHLLRAATKYATKNNDPDYITAIRLFIKEEQKHGNNLGKYIDLIGEERTKFDLGDKLFRMVRYFNSSMELWTITVIIVESAAQLFYQALRDASQCQLLDSICNDILIDEAHHIKFQNERMRIIFNQGNVFSKPVRLACYHVLFEVVVRAVWFGHHKAFKAGGFTENKFNTTMRLKFYRSLTYAQQPVQQNYLYVA